MNTKKYDDFKVSPEDYKEAVTVFQGQVADLLDHLQWPDEKVEEFIKTKTWNYLSMRDPQGKENY